MTGRLLINSIERLPKGGRMGKILFGVVLLLSCSADFLSACVFPQIRKNKTKDAESVMEYCGLLLIH